MVMVFLEAPPVSQPFIKCFKESTTMESRVETTAQERLKRHSQRRCSPPHIQSQDHSMVMVMGWEGPMMTVRSRQLKVDQARLNRLCMMLDKMPTSRPLARRSGINSERTITKKVRTRTTPLGIG